MRWCDIKPGMILQRIVTGNQEKLTLLVENTDTSLKQILFNFRLMEKYYRTEAGYLFSDLFYYDREIALDNFKVISKSKTLIFRRNKSEI